MENEDFKKNWDIVVKFCNNLTAIVTVYTVLSWPLKHIYNDFNDMNYKSEFIPISDEEKPKPKLKEKSQPFNNPVQFESHYGPVPYT